jgi:hypothetical protein
MQMVVHSAHAAQSIEGEELGTKVEPPVESQLAVATVAAVTLPVTNCTMSFPAPPEQVLTIFLDDGMRIVMNRVLMESNCSERIKTELQSVNSITLHGWESTHALAVVCGIYNLPIYCHSLLPGAIALASFLGITQVVGSFAAQ